MTQQTQLDPKPGTYKGRGVEGSAQYGESTNGNPELLVDVILLDLGNRRVTVPLYFTPAAAPYSFERLRMMGWEGNDLSDLKGIDKNEVSIEVRWESYNNELKMKVSIGGGGRFSPAKPTDGKTFAAKVAALTGVGAGGGSAGNGGAPPPPF